MVDDLRERIAVLEANHKALCRTLATLEENHKEARNDAKLVLTAVNAIQADMNRAKGAGGILIMVLSAVWAGVMLMANKLFHWFSN